MNAIDINEFNDIGLKQKLIEFNQQIEAAIKKSTDNINQKMKSVSKELKKMLKRNKLENIKNFRDIPSIAINHVKETNINYVINPTILILANLKVITNFIYAEKTKEILKGITQIDNQSFIIYFIALLKDMRDNRIMSPNYNLIHQYFKNANPNLGINYLCSDPGYWIKIILSLLENNIDLAKSNVIEDIENIITKKFGSFFCQNEECFQCGHKDKIPNRKSLIIPIILDSEVLCSYELNNIFNLLVLGERATNPSKYCPKCHGNLSIYKSIDKTSKYLIINIKRTNNNKMTLKFNENLKIYDDTDNIEYKYESISALTILDVNLSTLFIKDLNNQWNRLPQKLPQNINENIIKEEISKQNPNIIIYKKISNK